MPSVTYAHRVHMLRGQDLWFRWRCGSCDCFGRNRGRAGSGRSRSCACFGRDHQASHSCACFGGDHKSEVFSLPMCDVLAVVPEVVDPKDQKKRHTTHEALLYCSSTAVFACLQLGVSIWRALFLFCRWTSWRNNLPVVAAGLASKFRHGRSLFCTAASTIVHATVF